MSESKDSNKNFMKKIINNFKDPEFLKGFSTFIGANLIGLLSGSIFGMITLDIYEISYIKLYSTNDISLDHLAFYYPIEVFFQCFFTFVSGIIEKKLGLHLTNFIGCSILVLSYLIMFWSKSFFVDLISIALGGVGSGIIYYPSTTNACLWFPRHNGLVLGIIETVISLGSFFCSLLGEMYINPEEIESHEDDDLYDRGIARKMKSFIIIIIVYIIYTFILSYFLMYDKKDEEINNNKDFVDIDKDGSELYKRNSSQSDLSFKDNKSNELSEDQNYREMIWKACKSKKLLLFALILICESPAPSMIFSLYRAIGEYEKIDTGILQLIGSLSFIFECLSGILVGILCDYFNLKILALLITGLMSAIVLSFCTTIKNDMAYFWINNIGSFIGGGTFPFIDYYMMKVFGNEIYIELMGYISFLTYFVVVALSPLAYYLETSESNNKTKAYWILFTSLGILNLISFVLCFFINSEPFNYEESSSSETKENLIPEIYDYEDINE